MRAAASPPQPVVRLVASAGEVKRGKVALIPQSLAEAIACFEEDPVVQGGLGSELTEEFLRVKRQEWVRDHNTVSRWEVDRYLTLF